MGLQREFLAASETDSGCTIADIGGGRALSGGIYKDIMTATERFVLILDYSVRLAWCRNASGIVHGPAARDRPRGPATGTAVSLQQYAMDSVSQLGFW